jgi:hypothetical protein
MLDTVILEIENNFTILPENKFIPNIDEIIKSGAGFAKSVLNPTKEDYNRGIYYPRLTFIKRGRSKILKIEFSVPKLKYNNNLDEVAEDQFDELVKILQERLKEKSVLVFTKHIENAKVIGFHPSKNIPILNGYSSTHVIKQLSKINFSKHFDLNKSDYRNNGHSLHIHSKTNSFVLYDKIADLRKPKSRAIDKDKTIFQTNIFDKIQEKRLNIEILRLEVRLCDKRKIKKILESINFHKEVTFKNIFNKKLCKKIISIYWDKYFKPFYFLFVENKSTQNLFNIITIKNPNIKLKQTIFLVGLMALYDDEQGIRGLRTGLTENQWQTLKRELPKLKKTFQDTASYIRDIEENIDKFKPYLINLQCKEK